MLIVYLSYIIVFACVEKINQIQIQYWNYEFAVKDN